MVKGGSATRFCIELLLTFLPMFSGRAISGVYLKEVNCKYKCDGHIN